MIGRVSVNTGSARGNTPVSNNFIEKYLAEANDAQIKIYLYLLYSMNNNLSIDISYLSDKFNYTEKDVLRALDYLSSKGLIITEFDSNGSLIGIRIEEVNDKVHTTNATTPYLMPHASSLEEAFRSLHFPKIEGADITSIGSINQSAAVASPIYKKPKDEEKLKDLYFVIEQYIGHPLDRKGYDTILYIHDELSFDEELIDYLVGYCVDLGISDFRYIEKVALTWHENGITNVRAAKKHVNTNNKNVKKIINALGMNNNLADAESEFIHKWLREYNLPIEIIEDACRRTVLKTNTHRLEYCDSILREWKKRGIKSLSDVAKSDEQFRSENKKSVTKKSNTRKTVTSGVKNFTQNTYDWESLENGLLKNNG